MLKQCLCLIAFTLVAILPARADDLTAASLDLCEKVKSCAMSQVAEQDLTPQMREMMQPMLDNMCANMQSRIGEVPTGHEMYEPALACMRSMEEKMTCEMMQDPDNMRTPECEAYEKLAQEANTQP
jgi:hypothetical protein